MHRALAALSLVTALALPLQAAAETPWDMVKEEWSLRPWALIVVAPALLITAPFMLVDALIEAAGDDDDDDSE